MLKTKINMRELSRGELLTAILAAADKHPNSKVSKLIKCVQSEKSHKNIVLLLIELAEHPEFSTDLTISLKYYLDMFEELPQNPSFSDAGLLLLNSAIIYGKRVDNVHLGVESLILSLINTENVETEIANHNTISTPKTQKARKRAFEQLNGPYEANMSTKRFKTISSSKRFDEGTTNLTKKSNVFTDNRTKNSIVGLNKDFSHPTFWKYSVIEDYDYDDEIDSKKNYKLFAYHLEHRYNTLIPDINFKMYFKVKDFIDAEYKECTHSELWPPLSDAYIEHFVNLENEILHKEGHNAKIQYITEDRTRNNIEPSTIRVQDQLSDISSKNLREGSHQAQPAAQCSENQYQEIMNSDSGIGLESLHDTSFEDLTISKESREESCSKGEQADNDTSCNTFVDSQAKENDKFANENNVQNETLSKTAHDSTLLDLNCEKEDLTTLKVFLHLDDEGVFFSDLDERDQQMLSPAVVATDVFRCVKDKSNIIVIVDDALKRIYNIQEPQQQVLSLPVFPCSEYPLLPLNILKIHHKYFKKRSTFKLGSEFHLLKKERYKKYSREAKNVCKPRLWVRLCEDVAGVHLSPPSSPNYEPDFYGFAEEVSNDKYRTLSRDSGISLQQIENTLDKEVNVDFKGCESILQSPLRSEDFEKPLEPKQASLNPDLANALDESIERSEIAFNKFSETLEPDDGKLNEPIAELTLSENLTTVMSKVQEWHAHLQPILAQSRDRHHFDIFKLGSEIMSKFDRQDINNKLISLNHVMENKDSSLISRYFLSTLLLANQGNISININSKSSEIPSEINEVELKLLSKKRNTVSVEDNIGLRTPQKSVERLIENSMLTPIRTLKPVPTVPKTEDRDSGISMSDECSI